MRPKYKCMKCKCVFELETPAPTTCPRCKWIYVDWVNYAEWRKWQDEKNVDEKSTH